MFFGCELVDYFGSRGDNDHAGDSSCDVGGAAKPRLRDLPYLSCVPFGYLPFHGREKQGVIPIAPLPGLTCAVAAFSTAPADVRPFVNSVNDPPGTSNVPLSGA